MLLQFEILLIFINIIFNIIIYYKKYINIKYKLNKKIYWKNLLIIISYYKYLLICLFKINIYYINLLSIYNIIIFLIFW